MYIIHGCIPLIREPEGQWLATVELLPFSERTARYLMDISQHPDLSNPHHGADLPASWRTLSILAQLPPGEIPKPIGAQVKSEAASSPKLATAKEMAERLPEIGKLGGRGHRKLDNNGNKVSRDVGNSQSYLARRLRRDCPEIFSRLETYPSVRAAALEAGIVKRMIQHEPTVERRTGELLQEMDKAKGRLKRGKSPQSPDDDHGIKLTEIGITKNESSLWQKLAAVPEHFA